MDTVTCLKNLSIELQQKVILKIRKYIYNDLHTIEQSCNFYTVTSNILSQRFSIDINDNQTEIDIVFDPIYGLTLREFEEQVDQV